MLDKLPPLARKYEEIEYSLAQPEIWSDPEAAARLSREKRDLEPLMEAWGRYRRCLAEREAALAMLSDPEMRELARESAEGTASRP